jgi:hypothetical protein
MTDRLERAFRSLREVEDGRDGRSDETLARVLSDLRAEAGRGSKARIARVWLLAAAILVVTTAAAARSGSWGRVLRGLVLGDRETAMGDARGGPPRSSSADTGGAGRTAEAAVAGSASSGLDVEPPAPPTLSTSPEPARDFATRDVEREPARQVRTLAPVPEPTRKTASRSPADGPVASTAPASGSVTSIAGPQAPATIAAPQAPVTDGEVFAQAHRLHFGGSDPAAAIAAWDDYLRRFPAGQFVPEARYNRAIDLLKLGRTAEARAALEPFADGAYGSYRRDEARAMLRSAP